MITVQLTNNAGLTEKYIRLVKQKLFRISKRFPELNHVDVQVERIARKYYVVTKLKMQGEDIIIHYQHANVFKLYKLSIKQSLNSLIKKKEEEFVC